MPKTCKMTWPYPSKDADPWYDAFENFAGAMDASAYAAREDRQLILTGGLLLALDNAVNLNFSWSGTFVILSAITGFQVQIAAGSINIPDGSAFCVDIPRGPTNNVAVVPYVSNQVPSTDNAYVIAVRSGGALFFRNGWTLVSGGGAGSYGALPPSVPLNVATTTGEVLVTTGANTVATIALLKMDGVTPAAVNDILTVKSLGPPVFAWNAPTAIPGGILKGTLLVGSGLPSPLGILPVSTNKLFLMADAASALGVKWAAAVALQAASPGTADTGNININGQAIVTTSGATIALIATGGLLGLGGTGTQAGVSGTGIGSGFGVQGQAGPTSGSTGVFGNGTTATTNGTGVKGEGKGTGNGVYGYLSAVGDTGAAVEGDGTAATNGVGVKGTGTGTGSGILGILTSGTAASIQGVGLGGAIGVPTTAGTGVFGRAGSASGSIAIEADGTTATTNGTGLKALGKGTGNGVLGVLSAAGDIGAAVYGNSSMTTAAIGVEGLGSTYGGYFSSSSTGAGLKCIANATRGALCVDPIGSDPSAPVNGDMWTTTSGVLKIKVNGTVTPITGLPFQVLTFGSAATWDTIGTYYIAPGFDSTTGTMNIDHFLTEYYFAQMSRSGVMRNLRVRCLGTGFGTITFTVRKNGVDTAITAALSAAPGTSDLSHAVSFTSGDSISLKAVLSISTGSVWNPIITLELCDT